MRSAFRKFKIAATGRWAVALPVFLLTIPFGALVSIERESEFNPEFSLSNHVLITTAGYMASFLYIFTMQATLLKNRRVEPQALWKCLFVWYSTGVVQGCVAAFYAHQTFGDGWHLVERVGMPTFYTGSALALIAFYFGSIERRRVEDEALRRLNHLLAVDRGELISSDAAARGHAREVMETVLRPQIESLQSLLEKDFSEGKESASVLIEKSKEISSALTREAESVARSRVSVLNQEAGEWKSISFLSGIFPHTLSVRISVLVIAFGAFTGQFPRNGIEGVIAGECGAVLIGVLLFLLSRIVKALNSGPRNTFLIFSYILVFFGQALWTYLMPIVGFELANPYPPFYSALKTLYGVYLASIISSLIVDTSTRLEESKKSSDRTLDEVALLTREQENLEHHLFTTRFGTIQGKISGVIMALRLLDAASENSELLQRRDFLVSEARNLLDGALQEIRDLGSLNAQ